MCDSGILAPTSSATRRAEILVALQAHQQPRAMFLLFGALAALGLALLGRPGCAVVSFVALAIVDFYIQHEIGRRLARSELSDTAFAALARLTLVRHSVIVAGPIYCVLSSGGRDAALYATIAAAVVLLLSTFQCGFDRKLFLAAAFPGAVTLILSAFRMADEPHGVALCTGLLIYTSVCIIIAIATARVHAELASQQENRALMIKALAIARDRALEDRVRAETAAAELGRRETLLAQTARIARVGSWEYTPGDRTLFWSDETRRIHRVTPHDEIFTFEENRFLSSAHRPMMQKAAAALLARGEPFDLEVALDFAPEDRVWVRYLGEAEVDDDKVVRLLGSVQDVTDRRAQEQEIQRLAFSDELTKLPNRSAFQLALRAGLHGDATEIGGCGLLLLDVDHFKDVNDTLGHDAGDGLLCEVAQRLRTCFPAEVTVARLGGDEFAIILPDVADPGVVLASAQAACRAVNFDTAYDGGVVTCSATLGAAYSAKGEDAARFLKNADIALYDAKAAGRNCAALFAPEMRCTLETRVQVLRDARDALDLGHFEPWFQPLVLLGAEGPLHLEALARWRHPERGILTPASFAEALNDSELSSRLGDYMLEAVLCQVKAWQLQELAIGRVGINLSPSQFRRSDLADHIGSRLRYWGVSPERLALEITETVYLGSQSLAIATTLAQLHEMGLTIALDDFGTGYASLANLRQFPIDVLKIDRSFVADVEAEPLIRTIIQLAKSLGMSVVAEGVETVGQLVALRAMGCDMAQGFFFSAAMPGPEVALYLRDAHRTVDAELGRRSVA